MTLSDHLMHNADDWRAWLFTNLRPAPALSSFSFKDTYIQKGESVLSQLKPNDSERWSKQLTTLQGHVPVGPLCWCCPFQGAKISITYLSFLLWTNSSQPFNKHTSLCCILLHPYFSAKSLCLVFPFLPPELLCKYFVIMCTYIVSWNSLWRIFSN